jgi:hypothetical protein
MLFLEAGMQVTRLLIEHLWLAPLILSVWLMQKLARTAARMIRVSAWDWLLKLKGVPEARRRELIDGAAEETSSLRDLPKPAQHARRSLLRSELAGGHRSYTYSQSAITIWEAYSQVFLGALEISPEL